MNKVSSDLPSLPRRAEEVRVLDVYLRTEIMFQQIGGVKIGRDIARCWNIGWPFARLLVRGENLEIRVFLFGVTKVYRFTKNEIVQLRVAKATFSRVLVIEHRNANYPQFIAFEAFPSRKFQALLDEMKSGVYRVVNGE